MKKFRVIGIIVIFTKLGFVSKQLFSSKKTDNGKDYKTLPPTRSTIVEETLAIGTITPRFLSGI